MDELEQMAANVEEELQPTSPVEPVTPPDISETKAFSERLKRERAKIESEAKLNLAREEGFDSWDEYQTHKQEEKIQSLGYDPDSIRPIVSEMLKNHPSIIEAERIKKEREESEATRWASEELNRVNTKFKTNFKSIDEVGENVKTLWEKGIPLEKAYAIENLDQVTTKVTEAAVAKAHSKDHLQSIKGTGGTGSAITISKEEKEVFKGMFPGITDAQIMDWYSKQNK